MQIKHRVYYNETDQMGRVYHANFLFWMEKARTEWLRVRGMSYKELEDSGIMLPVLDLSIKYINPVSYDEEVIIDVSIEEFTKLKVKFLYKFFNKNNVIFAESKSTNVFTDKMGKLKRLDNDIFLKIKEEK
ncbi:MAG: acyl-CoA thioesterase [Fusobacteriaceae bacterium]|nr:acyl-CoA thioesterase [Fusobacteriaceae bacterium]MBN2838461.1 acyl-CoA thioesterase [Fusobacteriaceae bacterium]